MINYRHLFNPDYNYIGIILIFLLIILIFLNNHNIKQNIEKIGIITTISSLTTLTLSLLINFFINIVLPQHYQLFIEVISKNITKNIQISSVVAIFLGGTLLIVNKFFLVNQNN